MYITLNTDKSLLALFTMLHSKEIESGSRTSIDPYSLFLPYKSFSLHIPFISAITQKKKRTMPRPAYCRRYWLNRYHYLSQFRSRFGRIYLPRSFPGFCGPICSNYSFYALLPSLLMDKFYWCGHPTSISSCPSCLPPLHPYREREKLDCDEGRCPIVPINKISMLMRYPKA